MEILYWLKSAQVGQSAATNSRAALPSQRELEGGPQRFRPPALHGPTRRELRVTAFSRGSEEVALPVATFPVAASHLPQLQRSWLRAPYGLAGQRGIWEKIQPQQ